MLKRVLWFCVNWLRSILAGTLISFNMIFVLLILNPTSGQDLGLDLRKTYQIYDVMDSILLSPLDLDSDARLARHFSRSLDGSFVDRRSYFDHDIMIAFLTLAGLNSILVHTLKTPYWRNKQDG